MATNSERQAAFRQRRDARMREMAEALRNQGDGAGEIAKLKAELATANAEIAFLKTLKWGNGSLGDDRYFSKAEPYAGAYFVQWHATNKPRGGGEWRPLPEGESYKASFSPWGKNNRRKKTKELGTFPTPDEARAACQAHAMATIAAPV